MRYGTLTVMLAAMFVLGACHANPGAGDGSGDDARQIRGAIDELWEAVAEQDREAFAAHASQDWFLFTARGNRFDVDRLFDMHEEHVRQFDVEIANMNVNAHGELAWVTYDATLSGQFDGEPWGGEFIITKIFQRVGDAWICVHMHESRPH